MLNNANIEEVQYLNELISDFPSQILDPVLATTRIEFRYKQLLSKSQQFLSLEQLQQKSFNPNQFVLGIQFYLYENILSNAGHYRSTKDKGGGSVFYGGVKQRSTEAQFSGAAPDSIPHFVNDSFLFLLSSDDISLDNALLFYRKFVRTHPFYDGNGRIARLIVNSYLANEGISIDWSRIPHGKFLGKLNQCHKVESDETLFKNYFALFVSFVSRFTVKIDTSELE